MPVFQLHCNVTRLENLPYELLRMIFQYLTIFDIYHAFYDLNSAFNSLIKGEQLDFYLPEKMLLKYAMFAVEHILLNLGKEKLRTIEINHNTLFCHLIKLNSSFSYISLHTIYLKTSH